MTVYHPLEQEIWRGRLFVHARTDPYAGAADHADHSRAVGRSAGRAGGYARRRARRCRRDRLNTLVFGGFAGVALTVGVAGVLAFSVSARTRESGSPSARRRGTSSLAHEATVIAAAGLAVGVGASALTRADGVIVQAVRAQHPAGERQDAGHGDVLDEHTDDPRERDSPDNTRSNSGGGNPAPSPDPPEQVPRRRADGEPDAELARPRADRKRQDARHADHRDRQRDAGESAEHHRVQPVRRQHLRAHVVERRRLFHRLIRRSPRMIRVIGGTSAYGSVRA